MGVGRDPVPVRGLVAAAERRSTVLSSLEGWIDEVARELGVEELVDAEVVAPLVLDMTKDVAHGVARPAAPISAYLLGLAVGRSAGSGPGEPELAQGFADLVAARAREYGQP